MTKPMRATVCLVAFALAANLCGAGDQTSAVKPLAHAHAHNDYLHRRPLRDALFPDAEREKVHAIVKQAHESGRHVRLWATPDGPVVWKELLAAGVDLINTDDLDGLEDYFRRSGKE